MKKEINQIGKDVIDLQIKSLRKLRNSIDYSFERAVKSIQKCKSKVIICGVGKSGIIASKISATLSSVGTPSFAVSASDCSHGDLGRITNKDILILISYSGNTLELEVVTNFSGYITFVDNYDPNWFVKVNGSKINLLKFLDSYKSVKIEKGKSKVIFYYNPWQIKL